MTIRSPFDAINKEPNSAPAAGLVDQGLGEAYEVVKYVRDNIVILATLGAMTDQLGVIFDNIGNFGNYALVGHMHTGVYAPLEHEHTQYAPLTHYHTEYALVGHDHNNQYQPIGSYALAGHNHDGRYLLTADAGVAYGAALLGADGKLPTSTLPALAISKPNSVASQAAQLALVAEMGDIAIRSDTKSNYIHNGGTSGTMADWTKLENATDLVTSVNGQSGTVVLGKADVGLGNVDNTSDANKPVSTAQAASIGTKEPTIAAGTALQYWRGDKTWQTMNKAAVGLGNVDNTSDANKPVSTAQAAAITSAIAAVDVEERARDAIGAALVAGTGITIVVNDAGDTITLSSAAGYTDEQAQDAVAAMLTAGAGITLTYNDAANTFTIANSAPAGATYTDENAQDAVAAMLTAGAGITLSYNDAANTFTIASTNTQYTDEMAQDAVAAMMVAGANITLTYNDAANTFTIASTATGGGSGSSGTPAIFAKAYRNGAFNSQASGGFRNFPMDTISVDPNVWWDPVYGGFKPPAGTYLVNFRVRCNSAAFLTACLMINGAQDHAVNIDPPGSAPTVAASGVAIMTVNGSQTISAGAYVGNSTVTGTTGAFDTYLEVSSFGSASITPGNLVAELTADGTSGVFSIPNIPANYKSLRVEIVGRGGGDVKFTFNNDTGANYSRARRYDGNASGVEDNASQNAITNTTDFSGGTAPVANHIILDVLDYLGTSFNKSFSFRAKQAANAAGTSNYTMRGDGQWASTAAINRIDAISGVGNFTAGTKLRIYGQGAVVGAPAVSRPAIVQKIAVRGDVTATLPAAPTVGNTMVWVAGGFGNSLGGYVPAGFTIAETVANGTSNAVIIAFRTVVGGDTGSYAVGASDNQQGMLYEVSGLKSISRLQGGDPSGSFSGSNFTLGLLGSPFTTSLPLLAFEHDTANIWGITAQTGLVVDYTTPSDGNNHTGAFVHLDPSFVGPSVTGTLTSPTTPIWALWALNGTAPTGAATALNLDYSLPLTILAAPTASEVVLMHVFAQAVAFPVNFNGAQKFVTTNPAATFAFDVQRSVGGAAFASIGSISISNAGVVTFATTTTPTFAIGDAIKIIAQAGVDTLANAAFTLKGTKS